MSNGTTTLIDLARIIIPKRHADDRGWFSEISQLRAMDRNESKESARQIAGEPLGNSDSRSSPRNAWADYR